MCLLPILNDSFIRQKRVIQQNYKFSADSTYCLISVKRKAIVCSLFTVQHGQKKCFCQINFSAISSSLLFNIISKHRGLCNYLSLSHLLYIGKEIYKADLSKTFHQEYIQL